jgi:tRNA A-37 threonylcarbamoyl transferase component Bud32/tetratricopeptide (TPR) repeat protein
MSDVTPPPPSGSFPEALLREFEDCWRGGGRPTIEGLLPEGKDDQLAVLIELVHLDLFHRLRAGEHARVEEYFLRYPELSRDQTTAVELIVEEYELRRQREPGLDPLEYQQRFPQYKEQLARRLKVPHQGATGAASPVTVRTTAISTWVEVLGGSAQWPRVPGYEVLGELGRGGMGVVYKARHLGLNRIVALKMVLAGAHAGSEGRLRFLAEAAAVAALRHPNIVQVYDFSKYDDLPYMALEYVDGGTLSNMLRDGLPLPGEAARLVEQLARGMATAHAQGIIHRDLKPHNVLLQKEGLVPKITDFGLAKNVEGGPGLTQTGAVMGTPSYMAPEQAWGHSKDIGPLVDVYALGAILYELLTGRPPFRGSTVQETLEQVRHTDPVAPSRLQPRCPRDLETVCLKCLNKETRKRYSSAQALAEDLRRYLDSRPILARRVSLIERIGKWARRRPAVAALVVVTAAATAGLAGGGLWYNLELQAQRNRAVRGEEQARQSLAVARAAADTLVAELAQGIKPLAGTQSPALQKILDRAAVVYDELLAQGESTAAMESKAKMLNAFADLYLELNDSARALSSAREAARLYEALLSEDRGAPPHVAGLASSHEMVGRVLHEQGHLKEAQQALEYSIALREELKKQCPDDDHWQAELASGYNWLANVLWEEDDAPAGKKANAVAIELRKHLAEVDPTSRFRRREHAVSQEKVGDFAFEENELPAALEAYQAAAVVYRELVETDPAFTDAVRDLARIDQSIGDVYRAQGEVSLALASYKKGEKTAEKYARQDLANVQWQRLVLGCQLKIGQVRGAPGPVAMLTEKRKLLQALRPLAEQSARRDPARARWRSDVASVDLALGQVHAALAATTIQGLATLACNTWTSTALAAPGQRLPLGPIPYLLCGPNWDGGPVRENQDKALASYVAAKNALEEVLEKAPTYVTGADLLFQAHQVIGKWQEDRGEPIKAVQAYLHGWRVRLARSERFAAAFPSNSKWQRLVAECRREVAAHLMQQVNLGVPPGDSLTEASRELDVATDQFAKLCPNETEWRTELAEVYSALAAAWEKQGRRSESAAAAARSKELSRAAGEKR